MRDAPLAHLASEFLKKQPDIPARTAAKELLRLYPTEFATLERARNSVRYALGQRGKRRKWPNSLIRPHRKPGEGAFPEPKTAPSREPFDMGVTGKVLVLSDIHVPYHDMTALMLAINEGKRHDVKGVLLLGDIMDFYAMSFFQKDPRQRDFFGELVIGRQMLEAIRESFPKARIVFKEGNHDERFELRLMDNMPDLIGVDSFALKNVLQLEKNRIEHVGHKRRVLLGRLNCIHGHEYRFSIANPVNPARGLFLRAKACGLCGHFHQTSQHSERTLEGKLVSTWSQGCLCHLSPDYAPINNWDHSFTIVDVDGEDFHVLPRRIVNGRIV